MGGYTIGEIEDGILSTLQAAEMGAYLRTLETWGAGLEDRIAKRAVLIPACYVVFLGGNLAGLAGGGQDFAPGRFGVIVLARNLRGERAARRGGPGPTEMGTYEMIDDARAALHNSTLGLDILDCRARRIEPLDLGPSYAAYMVELEIEWRFES